MFPLSGMKESNQIISLSRGSFRSSILVPRTEGYQQSIQGNKTPRKGIKTRAGKDNTMGGVPSSGVLSRRTTTSARLQMKDKRSCLISPLVAWKPGQPDYGPRWACPYLFTYLHKTVLRIFCVISSTSARQKRQYISAPSTVYMYLFWSDSSTLLLLLFSFVCMFWIANLLVFIAS